MTDMLAHHANSECPIDRAVYWLIDMSWRHADEFETLQQLTVELDGYKEQREYDIGVLREFITKVDKIAITDPALHFGIEEELLKQINMLRDIVDDDN